MRRFLAMAVFAMILHANCAHAQNESIDCNSFVRNTDGSWTVIKKVFIPVQNVRVVEGTIFRPGSTFLGDDMTVRLARDCPNTPVSPSESVQPAQSQPPKVRLSQYADANGNIDVQQLTCGELAGASDADADFILTWYSGLYHGIAKQRIVNPARVRYLIGNVMRYCKTYPEKKLVSVMELWLK